MADFEGNASPPSDSYDFDASRVEKRTIYLTALGTPCQYLNILAEIDKYAFVTPSDSEETELSSDESISSKASSQQSVIILPISTSVKKIKEEKLSDTEDSSKSKSNKLKITKQSPPKSKKWPVVDYSDSDSGEDKEDLRHKKPDDYRSKGQGKKNVTDSPEDRSKSSRKKYSKSPDEDRFRRHRKKYSASPDEGRYKHRRKKYSDSSDEGRSKHRRKKHSDSSDEGRSPNYRKKFLPVKKEEEYKYNPGITTAFGQFHCKVCDIIVNSETTYQTHLQGKRHQKNLKAKTVPEVVRKSMNEPRIPPQIPHRPLPPPINPPKKPKHVTLKEDSLIQQIAEDYKDGPLPGLDDVVEVRPPIEGVRDISYLCKICEAQCVPNSIMKHLTGFKHYLRCLEKIDSSSYERYRYIPKRQIEWKVKRILDDHEKKKGRGRIRVEKEVAEEYPRRDEPGPSWRDQTPVYLPSFSVPYDDDDEVQLVSAVEHLDTSMSDFFCRACDAHMNSQAMWEAHVRGKRHLKNIKKVPGESTSKIKAVQCTNETAHLMDIIRDSDAKDEYGNDIVIVGLGYIKETHGEGGDLYNCYLCGACTSSFDIIDHLNQTKHKIKYLEEMDSKGYPNGIEQIKSFTGFSAYSKECMINDECLKSKSKYGDGKVSVYKSKNMFPPSYGSHL
ncbi:uncharacterized protein [Parasteatoda tepidariorum]|uniref:uncharacterized protein n=1 Tax=Parasteatoda tepidariorum TaxID=114398 RepID=UPI00077FAE92|nr:uncharacterized protein LOC107437649 isoform X2 [Parasteatoda tepidariorum]XP_015905225.1 uncharacterized protein LOC107437649 isoform X2 [Parasteatoda tepidariorum]